MPKSKKQSLKTQRKLQKISIRNLRQDEKFRDFETKKLRERAHIKSKKRMDKLQDYSKKFLTEDDEINIHLSTHCDDNEEIFQKNAKSQSSLIYSDTDHTYCRKSFDTREETASDNPITINNDSCDESLEYFHLESESGDKKRLSEKVDDDNNGNPIKKARLETDCGSNKRQLTKEEERKERIVKLYNYYNKYSVQLANKAKRGNETARLYQKVLAKQCKAPEVCTCCMRKLYDGIKQLTNYKRQLITKKKMDNDTYYFKESEFICDQCWNNVRLGKISKRAATKNLSFIEIPNCLERLSPLGARLVSPWLPFMQIVPLQQYTVNPQLSVKGSIVNIEVDVGEMMKCLPRYPKEAQVVQIILKRKKEHKTNYMAENVIVEDIKQSMEFLSNSKLYKQYDIRENEEFFTQFTQKEFPFVVDDKDQEYLLKSQNELFTKFNNDDDDDDNVEDIDYDGDFDRDNVLIIDQNREAAELTRIIAPGENKKPVPLYKIPYYEIFCFPQIFGGEPYDEAKILTVNEKHKLWLTHKDPRCRIDPTFVLLLGQMTVQKRTRDSMSFVSRRGCKNESLKAKDLLQKKVVDELISKDKAYKFLKPIVGSPAYLEDKKKFLIAKIAQIGPATLFVTFSITLESDPYILQQLYEEQYNKKINLQNALDLEYNEKLLLIRNNPVTCARYINRYFSNIQNCLQKIPGPFKAHYVEDFVQKDEVQQKGTLHRHMLFWLNAAPEYDPEDSKSVEDCAQFIDNFITCRLDPNNPYIMNYQVHKHTFTCYKGSKNLKKCRFHYPLWPMPETKILAKLPTNQRNEQVKLNFQKITDYLNNLSKFPRKISFAQILIELELSELEYIEAARFPLQTTRVFLKRESNELFINAYNPDILSLLKSNMDIQFICDAYACVTYLTDYVVKVEKDMAKLFRNLTVQFAQGDFTNLEKIKIIGNAFMNKRVLSGQAAAGLVLHIPGFKSSRYGVVVPTFPSEERTRVVKNNKELSEMAPESTDIYQANIIEKYSKRAVQYESLCLADVATGFNDLNKLIVKQKAKKKVHDSAKELSDCENIDSDSDENIAKQRLKRKILRTRHHNKYQDEDNYYREQLLLYLPFCDEKNEIEALSLDEKKDRFKKNIILIKKNRALIYKMDQDYIENLVKEAEENNVDNDESNEIITNEKITNLNESTDIFADINNDNKAVNIDDNMNGNTESKEKNYKISVSTFMEENDILGLLLKANEQQTQITMHCLHSLKLDEILRLIISGQAGTGKSFLIQLLFQVITNYYTKQIPCSDISSPRVVLAAPSGKAAFLIGGVTVHSCFVLPRDNKKGNLPPLSSSTVTSLRFEMRNVKVVIIDEVSMIGRSRFNQIDTRLQQITGNNSSFGGLSVIFVGDLRQLPPVMDRPIYYTAQHYLRDRKLEWSNIYPGKPFKPNLADPKYSELFATDNWVDFEYYELTRVMRQDNRSFVDALNNLSMGTMTDADIQLIQSRCNVKDVPYDAIHLFFKNKDADAYNDQKVKHMLGDLFVHNAKDNIQSKRKLSDLSIQKSLTALLKLPINQTGCLPTTISAKIGTKLMVTRNIHTAEGLVNGASGILRHVTKKDNSDEIAIFWLEFESKNIGRSIRSKYLSYLKNNALNMNLVPIFPIIISDIAVNTKKAVRQQFPLIVAEGMTVHKSQGQTFASVCVHNQGMTRMMQYVAYSRVGHHNNLYIDGTFKAPALLDDTSDLKVELDRLKTQKCLITFEQPLDKLEGTKIVFHNALSLHKYIGCVRNDKWFQRADIMIFAEARTLPTDNITIDRYEIIYRSDENSVGKKFLRGLIVYKKNDLEVALVNNLTRDFRSENNKKKIEHLDLVSLIVNDLFIVGGYVSPNTSRESFKKCLKNMIDPCKSDNNLVIIGDFNQDCFSNEVSWLEKYMNEIKNLKKALPPMISTTNFNTQIDVIFTNIVDYTSGTYESITSDHKPIFFCNGKSKIKNKASVDHSKFTKFSIPKVIISNSTADDNCEINTNLENSKIDHEKKNSLHLSNVSRVQKNKTRKRKTIPLQQKNSNKRIKKKNDVLQEVLEVSVYNERFTTREILEKIDACTSLRDIVVVLNQNSEVIGKISTEVFKVYQKNITDTSNNYRNSKKFTLKTAGLSIENLQLNHVLNNTFLLTDVKADVNCLFRSFAELIFHDENKYLELKLFIIFHVYCNKNKFESLISKCHISVKDKHRNDIVSPTLKDFLQMVARDGHWGNEGSLFAMSDALKVIIDIIGVEQGTHKKGSICKYLPSNTSLPVPITIVNEIGFHFAAAHRKVNSPMFDGDTWQGLRIIKLNIDALAEVSSADILETVHNEAYMQKKTKKNNDTSTFGPSVNISKKIYATEPVSKIEEIKVNNENNVQKRKRERKPAIGPNVDILKQIHATKSISEVKDILQKNDNIISKTCDKIKSEFEISYTYLVKNRTVKIGVPKARFPEFILNNLQLDDVDPDGNCFSRCIAELLLNDERLYCDIKMFIIVHIMANLYYYEVLCKSAEIEVRITNDASTIIDDPSVDDLIRMISNDEIWANEGSTIPLSNALGTKIIIFNVDAFRTYFQNINQTGPAVTQTDQVILLVNTNLTHYYVARLNNCYLTFNDFIENNQVELKSKINADTDNDTDQIYQRGLSELKKRGNLEIDNCD